MNTPEKIESQEQAQETKEQIEQVEEDDFLAGKAAACNLDGPCDSCQ